MTTTKWIMCILAASATSSYVTFHISHPKQNELYATSNIENPINFKTTNTTEQQNELFDIKKINSAAHDDCEKHVNPKKQEPADIGDKTANKEPLIQSATTEDLQLAYEKKQNEIASFRDSIEKTGANTLKVISDDYASEPINPEWAGSKENELQTLFDNNETLKNTAPLELSCKSKNCRVVLSAQDESQGESLYSAFKNEALKGSDANKKQIISYFNNPANGEIHIYLSKSTARTLFDREAE